MPLLPLNTLDCHFPHKQCWSIWSPTMPWASVSYWGQTGTKQGPNLAGSNLRGGFSRLIWTGNIWIIHHQHLPPHLLQLNNFGGLWATQTSFTVKYPNSNLMCQIDSYIFCIYLGGAFNSFPLLPPLLLLLLWGKVGWTNFSPFLPSFHLHHKCRQLVLTFGGNLQLDAASESEIKDILPLLLLRGSLLLLW